MMNVVKTIFAKVGEAAVLEQLAEESVELAHTALKLARIKRGQNPTPLDENKAFRALLEELGDVRVCLEVLEGRYGPLDTGDVEQVKLKRWMHRLQTFKSLPDDPT